jgi:hypothetical protein
MGFDLYGMHALNTKGEYFRNNVWWWRQLWQFITIIGEDILTEKDKQKGNWNNGEKINARKTEELVKALEEAIADGRAKAYADKIKRHNKYAKETNKGLKISDPGYDWAGDYPFTITNLKEFVVFAKNSGGFSIC